MRELSGERFYTLARQAFARAGIDLSAFDDSYVRAALETCIGKFRIFTELPPTADSISATISSTTPKASRSISRRRTNRASQPFATPLPRSDPFDAATLGDNSESNRRDARRESRRPRPSDASRRHRQQRRPEPVSSARSAREREGARANRSRAWPPALQRDARAIMTMITL